MQQTINNGDSGLSVRNALNSMFTELYGAILVPIKLPNIGFNTTVPIKANTFVQAIALVAISGNPVVRIGTTPNGQDILGDTAITSTILPLILQQYFSADTTLYITLGTGAINVRIDVNPSYF